MSLPPLTIPNFPLPFEIPTVIHPLFVHFAIALPIVVLILELINIFAKKRAIGVMSFFFMLLIAVAFLSAYLTGVTDGKAAKEFLSAEAKEVLVAHKQLGIYLVYSSGILLLFKLFSVMIRKTAIRILFFLVLLVFTAAVFNEGKKGGELVYKYGVNVSAVPRAVKSSEPKAIDKNDVKTEAAAAQEKKPKAAQIKEKKVEVVENLTNETKETVSEVAKAVEGNITN